MTARRSPITGRIEPAQIAIGARYGRLVVLGPAPRSKGAHAIRFACKCDCGKQSMPRGSSLIRGIVSSCGCRSMGTTTHGKYGSPTYISWQGMKSRCRYKKNVSYPSYGGRGIDYCERWESFENFLADMGTRPEGMSLDRIDVNGNYEPTNCRWATVKEQSTNKRSIKGESERSDKVIKKAIAIAIGARADGRLLMAEGKYKEAAEVLMAAILTFLPWEED